MTVFERSPYLELDESGVLRERAQQALRLLDGRCLVCPRLCKVDRLADRPGLCRVGRHAVVASHFPHFGEEDCLRGRRGSGTIFFSGCNPRCVFCQNHDISWQLQGERVTPERLAGMMLELQALGCHNINRVTPEHVVPQILEALPLAVDGGLRLPIVHNTSAYDSPESLALMHGVVDVYMPDFKLWSSELSRRYLAKRDYAEVARHSVREMHRQVGDLVLDADGMARRGLIVRHLVMPGLLEETEAILRFIADELGPDTYVNVMAQYYPAGRTDQFPEIDRHLYRSEFERALELAGELVKKIDTSLAPRLSKLPGFGGYHLVEAGEGVVSSIGFFDSSAQADESTRVTSNWLREEKLETALPNPPKITVGEVVVHKTRELVQA